MTEDIYHTYFRDLFFFLSFSLCIESTLESKTGTTDLSVEKVGKK